MPLQDQVVSIDFGQGLDTKTDPKMVIASKFPVLQNGIFTNNKRITKRNGYDSFSLTELGGTTISSPTMIASYKSEYICAARGALGSNRLYSYSKSLSGWEDRGEYASIAVSRQIINGNVLSVQDGYFNSYSVAPANSSSVTIGNYTLYAFDIYLNTQSSAFNTNPQPISYGWRSNNGNNATYITVIDNQTGQHLCDTVQIANFQGFSKAAQLGTSTFAVFGINTSNNLIMVVVTVSGSGVSVGGSVTIGSCAAVTTVAASQFPFVYDIATISTGAFVTVAQQPNLTVYQINTSGGFVTSAALANASGTVTPVTSLIDGSGNLWVYWVNAGTSLYYAIYSSSLSVVLAKTLITNTLSNPSQIAAINSVTNYQNLYYSQYATISASPTTQPLSPFIKNVLVKNDGTFAIGSNTISNVEIYGRPITINSTNYMPMINLSSYTPTAFLADLSSVTSTNVVAVAKFNQDSAEGIYTPGYNTTGPTPGTPVFIGTRFPGFLNSLQLVSSNLYSFGCGYVTSTIPLVLSGGSAASAYPVSVSVGCYYGVANVSFNFNSIDAFQNVTQQDTLCLNGGIVAMYDGAYTCELGFTIDPDIIYARSSAGGGGVVPPGTYVYYVTYRWFDANGNLYESAPSIGTTCVLGSTSAVTLQIQIFEVTQKKNISINVWRSDSNYGGNIAYLIGSLSNIPASAGGQTLTLIDQVQTSTVQGGPTLYTEANTILENIAPPPSMILWTNNNRLWAIDSENPESNIDYSKTASQGTGISFSTGQLELVIDSKAGAITGVAPMDEKTIILKQNGVGFFIGDGANDAGTGSTITNFQFIPSGSGCTNSKSVVSFPEGIIYRTNKGIYMLSRGVQTVYIGAEVEAFNSQDIQSAFIVPTKNQIRFLTSSGSSLLYDYFFNQWSSFTNHQGYSACNWNNTYSYVRTDGSIYTEDTSSFLDNATAFNLSMTTTWMALSSVQGFERVKWILPLGDYTNGSNSSHGLSITASYDFGNNTGNAVVYTFGAVNSSGKFQYRNFFSQQKCGTIQLTIAETTTGVSGEYIDLSNMSFVAAVKKGTNKLAPQGSVG